MLIQKYDFILNPKRKSILVVKCIAWFASTGLFCYSWFHIKGTWSVHSFNGDYLSIPEGTGNCEYLFHEIPGTKTFNNNSLYVCYQLTKYPIPRNLRKGGHIKSILVVKCIPWFVRTPATARSATNSGSRIGISLLWNRVSLTKKCAQLRIFKEICVFRYKDQENSEIWNRTCTYFQQEL